MVKLVGIDYSMTSPAICLFDGDEFKIENCKFHFLTNKKFLMGTFGQFVGTPYPDYHTEHADQNTARFDQVSQWTMDIITEFNPDLIAMEGYSMSSSAGRAFDIAENTGLLKYKLFVSHITNRPPMLYPPKSVKKFAVGNGNAKKEPLVEKFTEETGLILNDILGMKSPKVDVNPITDIVDSYFITKFLFADSKALI